jgi:hypothetical protein
MKRKLPIEFRNQHFEEITDSEVNCIELKTFPVKIKKIINVIEEYNRNKFDIETETHNFFAHNILVHNSQSKFVYNNGRMYCGSKNQWKRKPGNYLVQPKTFMTKIIQATLLFFCNQNVDSLYNFFMKYSWLKRYRFKFVQNAGSNAWWEALNQNPWIENWCKNNPNVILYGEVVGCFSYKTPIMLADGTKKMIGEIVNKKLPLEVKSLNLKTGVVENKKIIGWLRRESKPEEWMYLSYKRKHWGGKKTGINLTKNHRVYTKNFEEIEAKNLKIGDTVYLYSSLTLNYIQEQFILGTLLGDGYYDTGRTLAISHSKKQKEYFELKTKIMKNIIYRSGERISGHGAEMLWYATKSLHNLSSLEFDKICYSNNGKKLVTKSWLCSLTPIALAFWYMDDGTLENYFGKTLSLANKSVVFSRARMT